MANSLSYHCLKNISFNDESEGTFKKKKLNCEEHNTKKVKQLALDLELGIFSGVIGPCL